MIIITIILLTHIIIPLLVSGVKSLNNDQKKKVIVISSFIILFGLSAFRSSNMGSDTSIYYNLFENLEPFIYPDVKFEIGYMTFNSIIKVFFKNAQWIIITTSLFNLILIYKFFYKESRLIWFSLFLFVSSRAYFGSLNTIRQFMALGILLASYDYLKKDKIIKYVATVIIASTFHISALIFLLAFLFKKIKSDSITVALILILTIIVLVIPNYMLFKFPLYSNYFGGFHDNAIRPAAILNSIIFLIALVFGFNFKQKDVLLEKIVMLGFLISILGVKSSIASRLSDYFIPFLIVYLVNTISMLKKEKKIIFTFILVMMFIFYYYIVAIYRPEWNSITPYEFFW